MNKQVEYEFTITVFVIPLGKYINPGRLFNKYRNLATDMKPYGGSKIICKLNNYLFYFRLVMNPKNNLNILYN